MSLEELKKKYKEKFEKSEFFKLVDITTINYKPHPYVVGPKHVSYASDHQGGALTEETCRQVPCAYPKCKLSYDEHTYDTVIALSLTRDTTQDEANEFIKSINEEIKQDDIDGYIFVETEEKFRFV